MKDTQIEIRHRASESKHSWGVALQSGMFSCYYLSIRKTLSRPQEIQYNWNH